MKSNTTNMLSGSIFKGLISMSVPIMIMNVSQMLFSIIDMTSLKWFVNDKAVGAVGACGTLSVLITSLLIGIAAGANVVVAKRVGSGNKELAKKAAMTSILVSFVGGLFLLVIGVLFAEKFLIMTNCPKELLKDATLYFKIYFCGVPIMMLYNFFAALLRAVGDTKKPMYFLIIGGAVKVITTAIFLSITDMTVDGVAFSSIISNLLTASLSFLALIKIKDIQLIDFKEIKFSWRELREILFIGIPAGLQSSLYSLANVLILTSVNSFGADATTGISIANQFDGILYQITYAPSLAVAPYVAQNIGAKNIKRVKEVVFNAIIITALFGGIFGAFSALYSRELSSIMSSSPAVINFSRQKMIIISSTYFICGINEVMCGALRGIGKPILPTVSTLIYMCVFRFIWVIFIFPLCYNLTFLYLVWPISWILSIITLFIAYIPAISKLQKLYNS